MSTIYDSGADGPWQVDDDSVFLDGFYKNGNFYGGHPTVDGVEGHPKHKHFMVGGLVRGHDFHLAHNRDANRGYR